MDFLREGSTCWRVAEAERAAVLIDGAAYFAALRAAISKARRSVFIVGWDIDSRVDLAPRDAGRLPDQERLLGPLLTRAVSRQRDLRVHLLLWDYTVLYALDREPLPRVKLDWATPDRIQVGLDDCLPLGASHHQKIVVIDDALAFVGGIDLTGKRWDTPAHRPDDPDRLDPAGEAFPPVHDVQMMLDGEAAAALGALVRERWHRVAGKKVPPLEAAGDPWPEEVTPDFEAVFLGIARTLPEWKDRSGVREVEALFLKAIGLAERSIYIENQYLTSETVARALCERLSAVPELEVVIVGPRRSAGWLEAKSMGAGRAAFLKTLEAEGFGERVRVLFPVVKDKGRETPVYVHAKVMVVDDRLLRIGSANLNNRSMGLDSECDLAIEAKDEEQRKAIAAIRDGLMAEHLGVDVRKVEAELAEQGSLLRVVDGLTSEDRRLRPIRDEADFDDNFSHALREIADRERPVRPEDFIGDMFGGRRRPRWRGYAALVIGLAMLLILVVSAWLFGG